ncbi:regucalcin-like [Thrips palmi]|uniref:Regucalcin n=1 Tax=Thrips palmi TaxID=161013 RepID=A0A6P8Z7W0_THRPL|nr:regucalcin-like [Thrips palmi]XP_034246475.1 regucalcin-like [Thrips palmi]
MAPVFEKVWEAAGPVRGCESPHWDAEAQCLYFVDLVGCKVVKYHPASKRTTSASFGKAMVNFAIPVAGRGDAFVAGRHRSVVLFEWDGVSSQPRLVQTLDEVQADAEGKDLHLNDGKADYRGRLWSGTMCGLDPGLSGGVLFNMDEDGKARVRRTGVTMSNGLDFTPDGRTAFHVDSFKRVVNVLDVDPDTGDVLDYRPLLSFDAVRVPGLPDRMPPGLEGPKWTVPDGVALDAEGKLWVAVFNGGMLVRVDPDTGAVMSTLAVPAKQVTSLAFGGADLDELYVTSGRFFMADADLAKHPDSGAVFRVTGLGVKGRPGRPVRL